MSASDRTWLWDASALIALVDPAQPHHETAKRYMREALRTKATLYLYVMAAAEFHQRQSVTELPLRHWVVLPFNIDHAMVAGDLMRHARPAPDAVTRAVVRDDIKLIAQTVCESIHHVLVESEGALSRHIAQFNQAGRSRVACVQLDQGFDAAWFNGGQKSLSLPDAG